MRAAPRGRINKRARPTRDRPAGATVAGLSGFCRQGKQLERAMPSQNADKDPVPLTQSQRDTLEGASVEGYATEPPYIEPAAGQARASKARSAKAKISQLADKASAGVDQASAVTAKLNERAAAAYDRARAGARNVQGRVDPLVHERPYAAIGVAAVAGVLLGLLLGRGPKVIYLRDRD
jgi:ElaB/YqjD/DUF883 family membrane-anchored ribosome-binding protein